MNIGIEAKQQSMRLAVTVMQRLYGSQKEPRFCMQILYMIGSKSRTGIVEGWTCVSQWYDK